jgi:MFS family permease
VNDARRRRLPRAVFGLGLVSLLTDAASEMVFPFLPVFVMGLGGGALALGLIEGTADAVANLLKLVAGYVADRTGKRRPLVLAGYTLSSLARPFVAFATATAHVVAVRVVDRVGKGLRSAPRDALIAAIVPREHRGEAYGFHRAMDHAGAVLGPLLALAVLHFVTDDLPTLFLYAAIPGALAVLAAFVYAREPAAPPAPAVEAPKTPARELSRFLVPVALFNLSRASDVFLLALVSTQRTALTELPLLWIGLHLVRSTTARWGGRFADRRGMQTAIALGWSVHVAVFAALAFARDPFLIRALFLLYGLQAGLSEGAEKALIARIAPSKRWGAAFGWYHVAAGVFALIASVGFGALWEGSGERIAFLTSAGLAAVAVGWLLALR